MPSRPTLKTDTRGYWFTQWYEAGERKTRTFGHKSKIPESQAKRKFRNWKIAWSAGEEVEPDEDVPNLATLSRLYYEHAHDYYRRKDRTETGEAEKIEYALDGLVEMFGTLEGDGLTVQHLKSYRDRMIENGLARTTINMRINIVRRWVKWCIVEQGLNPAVLAGLQALPGLEMGRSGAVEPDPVIPVPEIVVGYTKEHLPQVLRDMIDLQLLTAMRPEEVCMMRPCDINISKKPWAYTPRFHKTEHYGHSRVIFLGPRARDIVAPYLKRALGAPLFSPSEAVAQRRGKAPTRRITDAYSTRSYRRAIHYAVDAYNATLSDGAASIERWGPNRLRHNALTSIERAHGANASRAVGGHRHVETTQRNYIERDLGIVRDLAEKTG